MHNSLNFSYKLTSDGSFTPVYITPISNSQPTFFNLNTISSIPYTLGYLSSSNEMYLSLPPGHNLRIFDVSGNTININVDSNNANASNSNNACSPNALKIICERCSDLLCKIEHKPPPPPLSPEKVEQCKQPSISRNNKLVSIPKSRGVSTIHPSLSPDSTTYPPVVSSDSPLSLSSGVVHSVPSVSSPHGISLDTVMLLLSTFNINDKCKAVDYLVKEISHKVDTINDKNQLTSSTNR